MSSDYVSLCFLMNDSEKTIYYFLIIIIFTIKLNKISSNYEIKINLLLSRHLQFINFKTKIMLPCDFKKSLYL